MHFQSGATTVILDGAGVAASAIFLSWEKAMTSGGWPGWSNGYINNSLRDRVAPDKSEILIALPAVHSNEEAINLKEE